MSRTNRMTGLACLILLWTARSSSGQQTPAPDARTQAPAQPATPFSGQPLAPFAPEIAPVPQPDPVAQPAGRLPAPNPPAGTVIPPPPAILIYGSTGTASVPARTPALGSELHNNIRENELRYREKSAEAQQEFARRQADERKVSAAATADKGFWERRRLTAQLRAAQAEALKEFDAEQERKRRLYEWRYP